MKRLLNLLTLPLMLSAAPAKATATDPLIGIWRADATFTPKLEGTLVIRKSAAGYAASIGGERANSTARGNELLLTFGRNGAFRGQAHGRSLEGFWIRPSSAMQSIGDPGGSGSSYATPVRMNA